MKKIFTKIERFFCQKWRLCVLDMKAGRWIVAPDSKNIPYLKAENANNRHILIQPLPKIQPYYILVDDVDWDILVQHHQSNGKWKSGRMIIETSPENYQVWIHSERFLPLEEKRFWLKKLLSDPGADPNNRWGRCPGFRNRKEKYKDSNGYFPLAKLIWVDWKHQAKIPNPFPHQPRGGVKIKIFPVPIMQEKTSLQRTLLLLLLYFVEDFQKIMLGGKYSSKDQIGITIKGTVESNIFLIKQYKKQNQLSVPNR